VTNHTKELLLTVVVSMSVGVVMCTVVTVVYVLFFRD